MLLGKVVERTCKCSNNSLLDVFEEYVLETAAIKEKKCNERKQEKIWKN